MIKKQKEKQKEKRKKKGEDLLSIVTNKKQFVTVVQVGDPYINQHKINN